MAKKTKKKTNENSLIYLEKFKAEESKCTYCGKCREVCPSFLLNGKESFSCRGRINLIGGIIDENNDLDFSKEVIDKLNSCLNCKSCIEACPLSINSAGIILSAKADYYRDKKRPLLHRYLFANILLYSKRTDLFFSFLKTSTALLGGHSQKKGILFRLVLKILKINPERIFPQIASKNFFKQDKRTKITHSPRKRIGLFIGCMGKYYFPDAVDHVVSLLRKSGIGVSLPKEQVCCGIPAMNNGDFSSARKMANKNLNLFNKRHNIEAIITICGSCHNALKNEYPALLSAGKFKVPVYDILEFIKLEKIDIRPKFKNCKVTYHQSSSMQENTDIRKTVSELFEKCYKQNFVRTKDYNKPCGASLDFNFKNYNSVKNITSTTLKNIQDSEAEIVGINSFACAARITEQAAVEKSKITVKHVAELFDVN